MAIKAIVKDVGQAPELVDVANTLHSFQMIVNGMIECIRWDEDHVMIVNEEGKIDGLPVNFRYGGDVIVGPAVWVGVGGEEFTDVDPDLLEEIEDFTGWHRYDLDNDTADLEDLIQTALGGEAIPLGGEESEQDND